MESRVRRNSEYRFSNREIDICLGARAKVAGVRSTIGLEAAALILSYIIDLIYREIVGLGPESGKCFTVASFGMIQEKYHWFSKDKVQTIIKRLIKSGILVREKQRGIGKSIYIYRYSLNDKLYQEVFYGNNNN